MDLKDATIKAFWLSGRNLHEQITIFENNSYTGNYVYIAVELRKLLCDKEPLLPRIKRNLMLFPLLGGDERVTSATTVIFLPGEVTVGNHRPKHNIIDRSKNKISYKDWSKQFIYRVNKKDYFVKDMIRSVADKQGAHADEIENDFLRDSATFQSGKEPLYVDMIIAIGKYILHELYEIAKERTHILRAESDKELKRKKYKQAHKYIDMALRFLTLAPSVPNQFREDIALCYQCKARVYKASGQNDKAEEEIKKAKKSVTAHIDSVEKLLAT